MRILFVQKDAFVNLGLMYLSSYVKKDGHDTDLIIDSLCKDTVAEVKLFNPDLIAFSCTTGIHTWAISLARKLKAALNVPIVFGGAHPTFFPEVIRESAVDVICVGEGELAFADLVNNLNKDLSKVGNISFKKDGQIVKNDVVNSIEQLDDLPFPDRNLYRRYSFIMKQDNLRVITGRGCPYNCTFCFNHALRKLYAGKGKYVRRRSINNVIDELRLLKGTYKRVDFQDDTFIINFDSWLKPFLVEYKREIGLPFTCCVRANLVTEDVVVSLKNAGCHSVKMGIESADESLNNNVLKRNLQRSQIESAILLFKKHSVKIETFSLIGIPGETIEQALSTMQFNADLGVDFARSALLQPYPRTEVEEYAKAHGYLDKNFNLDDFENSYFIDTPIILQNKTQFINLQRLFGLGVRFKSSIPLIKKLIKLPPNFLFDIIFKLDYALSIRFVDKVSIKDFISFGIRSSGFFSKK